jgi:N6-adenosine-specific RNA methylase IME4
VQLAKEKLLEFHEVARIFPMMGDEDYNALKLDIVDNGLLEPILTYQGKILDGRNRYRACVELGIEPKFQSWDGNGSPIQFVVSLNLKRRHLSSSQKAMIALEVEKQLAIEASKNVGGRPIKKDKPLEIFQTVIETQALQIHAAEQAAHLIGTNQHYVSDAKVIQTKAPDIAERVLTGELTIPKAKAEINRRERDAFMESGIDVRVPEGKYRTIVIDPPWQMEKILREVAPDQVGFEYPTMTIDQIKDFSIPADDDCHLFMWTTQKYLPVAFEVMNTWGFKYVFTMVWHKPGGFQPFNLPQYNCEFVIYGRKGTPEFVDLKAFPTCFEAPRREHSRKPDEFYNMIQRVAPGPRIDIFSREKHDGFDQYGNETEKFTIPAFQGEMMSV